MSKRKKILIGIILIVIFALCFIPNQNYNCKNKLEIISSYGDNQAYHPKVLAFKNKWNGYKYWMSYTPYPNGVDAKENPHIAVSNDLVTWKEPSEGVNPLDEPEDKQSRKRYNSDSHIVYNSDKNEIECYWRYVDDIENKLYIYRMDSKDGVNWSKKIVTAFSDDRKKKDFISPAIIYENNIYKMWYVDCDYKTVYATSKDGIEWEDQKLFKLQYPKKLNTWHLDVIHTQKGYEMVVVAWDKWTNRNDMDLYYTVSKNETDFETARVILKPSRRSQYWDNKGIYRSSILYDNGMYYVFYGGTKMNYEHGVGLVYGKDIDKLEKVDVDFKNKEQIENLIKKLRGEN